MNFITGLAGLLLVLTVEANVGSSSLSSFCTETKECLLFNKVCENDGYEVRHYEPTKWVTTEQESYFMEMAITSAFRRLFKYISGANDAGVKIDMTAPVIIKVNEKQSMWQPSTYTVSFLLPSAHQSAPPKPTDDNVYFTDMPDMKVYVRSYGGWMMSLTSTLQSRLLTRKLNDAGATYNKNFRYDAGYDSPMKIKNRHNEVWYMVEGEPVCSTTASPASA